MAMLLSFQLTSGRLEQNARIVGIPHGKGGYRKRKVLIVKKSIEDLGRPSGKKYYTEMPLCALIAWQRRSTAALLPPEANTCGKFMLHDDVGF